MTPGSMSPALWQRIVAASAEVDRAVAAVPPGAHLGADGTARLHRAVRDALDEVRAELVAALPERTAYEVLFPLVLHFDERVTARLGEADAAAWPLLQRELYDVETGGDLFYELADKRLDTREPRPEDAQPTLAMLLYCLRNGFIGKAADDPAEATRTASRLAAAITLPALPPAGAAQVVRRAASPRSATLYYVISAVLAAGATAFVVFGT